MSKAEAVANSGGDCDDVFQRAAKFYTGHITVGVNAKTRITELSLDGFCQSGVARRDGDRGGIAACHFFREGGATERSDARLEASV